MLVGLLRIVNLGVDSVADGWFWVNLNEGYSMGFGDGEWLVLSLVQWWELDTSVGKGVSLVPGFEAVEMVLDGLDG
ncbi:hypothetical protein V6N13_123923 [Hibiscus sabdariffa]